MDRFTETAVGGASGHFSAGLLSPLFEPYSILLCHQSEGPPTLQALARHPTSSTSFSVTYFSFRLC
jgi:hypothetical protein